jgi:hypothetical protein
MFQAEQQTDLITVEELASRLRVAKGTVYNKISRGLWTLADGIIHVSDRCTRIDWRIFERRLVDGKLGNR